MLLEQFLGSTTEGKVLGVPSTEALGSQNDERALVAYRLHATTSIYVQPNMQDLEPAMDSLMED